MEEGSNLLPKLYKSPLGQTANLDLTISGVPRILFNTLFQTITWALPRGQTEALGNNICAGYGQTHDILFNDDKTVRMYMPAKSSFFILTPLPYF